MPRFYLHMCDGKSFIEDDEGCDFADATAARVAAIKGLRETLTWDLLQGELYKAAFIEIENEDHELVETIHFDDVVRVNHAASPVPRPQGVSGEVQQP